MIIHNFDPIFIDLGSFQIRWYSIAYLLGIVLGWLYIKKIILKIIKKNSYPSITSEKLDDLIIYLVIGIIVGGRLGYVILYNFQYYISNPLDVLMIWKGGMSFHGGLIGILVVSFIFGNINKINFLKITDTLACAAPIGLFFGRIANFINGELYGKPSLLPWSVIFPTGGNISRHPSQIYEALLEGILLFIIINFFALKNNAILKIGLVSSLFLIYYSILRIIGEIYREPDYQIGYFLNFISMGVLLSLIALLVGLWMFFLIKSYEENNK